MMGSYRYESSNAERKPISRKPLRRPPSFSPDPFRKIGGNMSRFYEDTLKNGCQSPLGTTDPMRDKFRRISCSAPTAEKARIIAFGIKRHIIETKEQVKRTPNFVKRTHTKIIYLHNYNCRVASVSSIYPLDNDIKELLVKYIELEMSILKNPEYDKDVYRMTLEMRLLTLLSCIYSKYCFYVKGKFSPNDTWQFILELFEEVPYDVHRFFEDIRQKVIEKIDLGPDPEFAEEDLLNGKSQLTCYKELDGTVKIEIDQENDPLLRCCEAYNILPDVEETAVALGNMPSYPEATRTPLKCGEIIISDDELTDTGQLHDDDIKQEYGSMFLPTLTERLKSLKQNAALMEDKKPEIIDLCDDNTRKPSKYESNRNIQSNNIIVKTNLPRNTLIDLLDSSSDEEDTSVGKSPAVSRKCDKFIDSVINLDKVRNKENVISSIDRRVPEQSSDIVTRDNDEKEGANGTCRTQDESEILRQIRELKLLSGSAEVTVRMVNNQLVITPKDNLNVTDVHSTTSKQDSPGIAPIFQSSIAPLEPKPVIKDADSSVTDLCTEPCLNRHNSTEESSDNDIFSEIVPSTELASSHSLETNVEERSADNTRLHSETLVIYKSSDESLVTWASSETFQSLYETELDDQTLQEIPAPEDILKTSQSADMSLSSFQDINDKDSPDKDNLPSEKFQEVDSNIETFENKSVEVFKEGSNRDASTSVVDNSNEENVCISSNKDNMEEELEKEPSDNKENDELDEDIFLNDDEEEGDSNIDEEGLLKEDFDDKAEENYTSFGKSADESRDGAEIHSDQRLVSEKASEDALSISQESNKSPDLHREENTQVDTSKATTEIQEKASEDALSISQESKKSPDLHREENTQVDTSKATTEIQECHNLEKDKELPPQETEIKSEFIETEKHTEEWCLKGDEGSSEYFDATLIEEIVMIPENTEKSQNIDDAATAASGEKLEESFKDNELSAEDATTETTEKILEDSFDAANLQNAEELSQNDQFLKPQKSESEPTDTHKMEKLPQSIQLPNESTETEPKDVQTAEVPNVDACSTRTDQPMEKIIPIESGKEDVPETTEKIPNESFDAADLQNAEELSSDNQLLKQQESENKSAGTREMEELPQKKQLPNEPIEIESKDVHTAEIPNTSSTEPDQPLENIATESGTVDAQVEKKIENDIGINGIPASLQSIEEVSQKDHQVLLVDQDLSPQTLRTEESTNSEMETPILNSEDTQTLPSMQTVEREEKDLDTAPETTSPQKLPADNEAAENVPTNKILAPLENVPLLEITGMHPENLQPDKTEETSTDIIDLQSTEEVCSDENQIQKIVESSTDIVAHQKSEESPQNVDPQTEENVEKQVDSVDLRKNEEQPQNSELLSSENTGKDIETVLVDTNLLKDKNTELRPENVQTEKLEDASMKKDDLQKTEELQDEQTETSQEGDLEKTSDSTYPQIDTGTKEKQAGEATEQPTETGGNQNSAESVSQTSTDACKTDDAEVEKSIVPLGESSEHTKNDQENLDIENLKSTGDVKHNLIEDKEDVKIDTAVKEVQVAEITKQPTETKDEQHSMENLLKTSTDICKIDDIKDAEVSLEEPSKTTESTQDNLHTEELKTTSDVEDNLIENQEGVKIGDAIKEQIIEEAPVYLEECLVDNTIEISTCEYYIEDNEVDSELEKGNSVANDDTDNVAVEKSELESTNKDLDKENRQDVKIDSSDLVKNETGTLDTEITDEDKQDEPGNDKSLSSDNAGITLNEQCETINAKSDLQDSKHDEDMSEEVQHDLVNIEEKSVTETRITVIENGDEIDKEKDVAVAPVTTIENDDEIDKQKEVDLNVQVAENHESSDVNILQKQERTPDDNNEDTVVKNREIVAEQVELVDVKRASDENNLKIENCETSDVSFQKDTLGQEATSMIKEVSFSKDLEAVEHLVSEKSSEDTDMQQNASDTANFTDEKSESLDISSGVDTVNDRSTIEEIVENIIRSVENIEHIPNNQESEKLQTSEDPSREEVVLEESPKVPQLETPEVEGECVIIEGGKTPSGIITEPSTASEVVIINSEDQTDDLTTKNSGDSPQNISSYSTVDNQENSKDPDLHQDPTYIADNQNISVNPRYDAEELAFLERCRNLADDEYIVYAPDVPHYTQEQQLILLEEETRPRNDPLGYLTALKANSWPQESGVLNLCNLERSCRKKDDRKAEGDNLMPLDLATNNNIGEKRMNNDNSEVKISSGEIGGSQASALIVSVPNSPGDSGSITKMQLKPSDIPSAESFASYLPKNGENTSLIVYNTHEDLRQSLSKFSNVVIPKANQDLHMLAEAALTRGSINTDNVDLGSDSEGLLTIDEDSCAPQEYPEVQSEVVLGPSENHVAPNDFTLQIQNSFQSLLGRNTSRKNKSPKSSKNSITLYKGDSDGCKTVVELDDKKQRDLLQNLQAFPELADDISPRKPNILKQRKSKKNLFTGEKRSYLQPKLVVISDAPNTSPRTKTKAEKKEMPLCEPRLDLPSESDDDIPLAERVKSRTPSPKKSKNRYGTTDVVVGRQGKNEVSPLVEEKGTPKRMRGKSGERLKDLQEARAEVPIVEEMSVVKSTKSRALFKEQELIVDEPVRKKTRRKSDAEKPATRNRRKSGEGLVDNPDIAPVHVHEEPGTYRSKLRPRSCSGSDYAMDNPSLSVVDTVPIPQILEPIGMCIEVNSDAEVPKRLKSSDRLRRRSGTSYDEDSNFPLIVDNDKTPKSADTIDNQNTVPYVSKLRRKSGQEQINTELLGLSDASVESDSKNKKQRLGSPRSKKAPKSPKHIVEQDVVPVPIVKARVGRPRGRKPKNANNTNSQEPKSKTNKLRKSKKSEKDVPVIDVVTVTQQATRVLEIVKVKSSPTSSKEPRKPVKKPNLKLNLNQTIKESVPKTLSSVTTPSEVKENLQSPPVTSSVPSATTPKERYKREFKAQIENAKTDVTSKNVESGMGKVEENLVLETSKTIPEVTEVKKVVHPKLRRKSLFSNCKNTVVPTTEKLINRLQKDPAKLSEESDKVSVEEKIKAENASELGANLLTDMKSSVSLVKVETRAENIVENTVLQPVNCNLESSEKGNSSQEVKLQMEKQQSNIKGAEENNIKMFEDSSHPSSLRESLVVKNSHEKGSNKDNKLLGGSKEQEEAQKMEICKAVLPIESEIQKDDACKESVVNQNAICVSPPTSLVIEDFTEEKIDIKENILQAISDRSLEISNEPIDPSLEDSMLDDLPLSELIIKKESKKPDIINVGKIPESTSHNATALEPEKNICLKEALNVPPDSIDEVEMKLSRNIEESLASHQELEISSEQIFEIIQNETVTLNEESNKQEVTTTNVEQNEEVLQNDLDVVVQQNVETNLAPSSQLQRKDKQVTETASMNEDQSVQSSGQAVSSVEKQLTVEEIKIVFTKFASEQKLKNGLHEATPKVETATVSEFPAAILMEENSQSKTSDSNDFDLVSIAQEAAKHACENFEEQGTYFDDSGSVIKQDLHISIGNEVEIIDTSKDDKEKEKSEIQDKLLHLLHGDEDEKRPAEETESQEDFDVKNENIDIENEKKQEEFSSKSAVEETEPPEALKPLNHNLNNSLGDSDSEVENKKKYLIKSKRKERDAKREHSKEKEDEKNKATVEEKQKSSSKKRKTKDLKDDKYRNEEISRRNRSEDRDRKSSSRKDRSENVSIPSLNKDRESRKDDKTRNKNSRSSTDGKKHEKDRSESRKRDRYDKSRDEKERREERSKDRKTEKEKRFRDEDKEENKYDKHKSKTRREKDDRSNSKSDRARDKIKENDRKGNNDGKSADNKKEPQDHKVVESKRKSYKKDIKSDHEDPSKDECVAQDSENKRETRQDIKIATVKKLTCREGLFIILDRDSVFQKHIIPTPQKIEEFINPQMLRKNVTIDSLNNSNNKEHFLKLKDSKVKMVNVKNMEPSSGHESKEIKNTSSNKSAKKHAVDTSKDKSTLVAEITKILENKTRILSIKESKIPSCSTSTPEISSKEDKHNYLNALEKTKSQSKYIEKPELRKDVQEVTNNKVTISDDLKETTEVIVKKRKSLENDSFTEDIVDATPVQAKKKKRTDRSKSQTLLENESIPDKAVKDVKKPGTVQENNMNVTKKKLEFPVNMDQGSKESRQLDKSVVLELIEIPNGEERKIPSKMVQDIVNDVSKPGVAEENNMKSSNDDKTKKKLELSKSIDRCPTGSKQLDKSVVPASTESPSDEKRKGFENDVGKSGTAEENNMKSSGDDKTKKKLELSKNIDRSSTESKQLDKSVVPERTETPNDEKRKGFENDVSKSGTAEENNMKSSGDDKTKKKLELSKNIDRSSTENKQLDKSVVPERTETPNNEKQKGFENDVSKPGTAEENNRKSLANDKTKKKFQVSKNMNQNSTDNQKLNESIAPEPTRTTNNEKLIEANKTIQDFVEVVKKPVPAAENNMNFEISENIHQDFDKVVTLEIRGQQFGSELPISSKNLDQKEQKETRLEKLPSEIPREHEIEIASSSDDNNTKRKEDIRRSVDALQEVKENLQKPVIMVKEISIKPTHSDKNQIRNNSSILEDCAQVSDNLDDIHKQENNDHFAVESGEQIIVANVPLVDSSLRQIPEVKLEKPTETVDSKDSEKSLQSTMENIKLTNDKETVHELPFAEGNLPTESVIPTVVEDLLENLQLPVRKCRTEEQLPEASKPQNESKANAPELHSQAKKRKKSVELKPPKLIKLHPEQSSDFPFATSGKGDPGSAKHDAQLVQISPAQTGIEGVNSQKEDIKLENDASTILELNERASFFELSLVTEVTDDSAHSKDDINLIPAIKSLESYKDISLNVEDSVHVLSQNSTSIPDPSLDIQQMQGLKSSQQIINETFAQYLGPPEHSNQSGQTCLENVQFANQPQNSINISEILSRSVKSASEIDQLKENSEKPYRNPSPPSPTVANGKSSSSGKNPNPPGSPDASGVSGLDNGNASVEMNALAQTKDVVDTLFEHPSDTSQNNRSEVADFAQSDIPTTLQNSMVNFQQIFENNFQNTMASSINTEYNQEKYVYENSNLPKLVVSTPEISYNQQTLAVSSASAVVPPIATTDKTQCVQNLPEFIREFKENAFCEIKSEKEPDFGDDKEHSDDLPGDVKFIEEYPCTSPENVLPNYNRNETSFQASPAPSSVSQHSETTKETSEAINVSSSFQKGDHTYPKDVLMNWQPEDKNEFNPNPATCEYAKTYTEYPMDEIDFDLSLIDESSTPTSGIFCHLNSIPTDGIWLGVESDNPNKILTWDESSKVVVEAQPQDYSTYYPDFSCLNNSLANDIAELSRSSETIDLSELFNLTNTPEEIPAKKMKLDETVAREPVTETEGVAVTVPRKLKAPRSEEKKKPELVLVPTRKRGWTRVSAPRKNTSPPQKIEKDKPAEVKTASSIPAPDPSKSDEALVKDIQANTESLPQLVPLGSRVTTRSASKRDVKENYVTPQSQSLHDLKSKGSKDSESEPAKTTLPNTAGLSKPLVSTSRAPGGSFTVDALLMKPSVVTRASNVPPSSKSPHQVNVSTPDVLDIPLPKDISPQQSRIATRASTAINSQDALKQKQVAFSKQGKTVRLQVVNQTLLKYINAAGVKKNVVDGKIIDAPPLVALKQESHSKQGASKTTEPRESVLDSVNVKSVVAENNSKKTSTDTKPDANNKQPATPDHLVFETRTMTRKIKEVLNQSMKRPSVEERVSDPKKPSVSSAASKASDPFDSLLKSPVNPTFKNTLNANKSPGNSVFKVKDQNVNANKNPLNPMLKSNDLNTSRDNQRRDSSRNQPHRARHTPQPHHSRDTPSSGSARYSSSSHDLRDKGHAPHLEKAPRSGGGSSRWPSSSSFHGREKDKRSSSKYTPPDTRSRSDYCRNSDPLMSFSPSESLFPELPHKAGSSAPADGNSDTSQKQHEWRELMTRKVDPEWMPLPSQSRLQSSGNNSK